MVRLVFCLRRRPDLSREDFQTYWRQRHAPLVARHAQALGISAYRQLHAVDDRASSFVREPRGTEEPYDGVAELDFISAHDLALARSPDGRAAALELLADEREFIDLGRSNIFFTNVIDVPLA